MNWRGIFIRKASGTLLVGLILCAPAFAKLGGPVSVRNYIDALRSFPINYQSAGAICEQVARVDLAESFPADRYYIDTGIAYGEEDGLSQRPLGEIDVAVFDRMTDQAVQIIEMKCWNNNQEIAYSKARSQRSRFLNQVQFGASISLKSSLRRYTVEQFRNMPPAAYRLGGPKDSSPFGFDYELPLSYNQLMNLRDEMIACQAAGDCMQPSRR